ncbi:MAG: hypothetical protein IKX59_03585 [Bacteroidales bacterium]|nr:hypothetical protein [Bacteroidales bacterium]
MLIFNGISDQFARLHVAQYRGKKAPHKAVLILAVMDLIQSGAIDTPFIYLNDELIKQFNAVWKYYVGDSAFFKPDICKPFYQLQYEPFWRLLGRNKTDDRNPYNEVSYTIKYLRETYECAMLDRSLYNAMRYQDVRGEIRTVLISTYLTENPNSVNDINLA